MTTVDVDEATQLFLRRAEDEGLIDVAYATVDTPVGPLMVAATPAGLVRVGLTVEDAVLDDLAARVSPRVVEHPGRVDAIRRQLDEYFAGQRTEFELDIDWRLSHGFRRMVLERLYADVHFGEVTSYLDLARAVGSPKASRAVGTAMATNPLPIVVPCHRVLRTGGGLGGYGGGLPMKQHLLTLEGALLA
jgi:methylated-DNA-[protein]-cysteine S-methyltransferase